MSSINNEEETKEEEEETLPELIETHKPFQNDTANTPNLALNPQTNSTRKIKPVNKPFKTNSKEKKNNTSRKVTPNTSKKTTPNQKTVKFTSTPETVPIVVQKKPKIQRRAYKIKEDESEEPDEPKVEPKVELEVEPKEEPPVELEQESKDKSNVAAGVPEKKTEKKVKPPNNLIIYIKTRIPNFYKMRYEPDMTVTSSKSHTVFFDSSIKYYTNPIKYLPRGAPPNAVFTQFFEAGQFDTMINRILSDFRYMQKPKSLEESKNSGQIDNNIRITLQTLFAPNNLFYINKRPYTIVGMNWKENNWDIDTKPLDKLVTPYSRLSGKELKLAEKELEDIPEYLRQGNLASANLAKKDIPSNTGLGVEKIKSKPQIINPAQEQVGLIQYEGQLPKRTGEIFGELLQQNFPINYTNQQDITRDPITLLIVSVKQIQSFSKKNPNSRLLEYYNAFIKKKQETFTVETEFIVSLEEALDKQTEMDTTFKEAYDYFSDPTSQSNSEDSLTVIKNMIDIKRVYLSKLYALVKNINKIYESQHEYFSVLLILLKEIKSEYKNLIQYYVQPVLAEKCIDVDIDIASCFINRNDDNIYSSSYFDNWDKYKKCYKCLALEKRNFLNPQINYK
jgi:hypothetical protein